MSAESNDTIEELNLSWNHIRTKGAVAVAEGLKVLSIPCGTRHVLGEIMKNFNRQKLNTCYMQKV